MNLDEKIMVRCDSELKAYLEDEAEIMRERTQLPKIGAGTVLRTWAVERMRRSQARKNK